MIWGRKKLPVLQREGDWMREREERETETERKRKREQAGCRALHKKNISPKSSMEELIITSFYMQRSSKPGGHRGAPGEKEGRGLGAYSMV